MHNFLESCSKFKKLLRIEKVAQKLPRRICLGQTRWKSADGETEKKKYVLTKTKLRNFISFE